MSGAAYLGKKLNKEIVPVSVEGGYKIWPRHHTFPTFFTDQKGCLRVGEIIRPADYDSVPALNSAIFRAVASGFIGDKPKDVADG